ncbi:hypothetical protein [Nonomuraea rubra]
MRTRMLAGRSTAPDTHPPTFDTEWLGRRRRLASVTDLDVAAY